MSRELAEVDVAPEWLQLLAAVKIPKNIEKHSHQRPNRQDAYDVAHGSAK